MPTEVQALLLLFERVINGVDKDFMRWNAQACACGDTSKLPMVLQWEIKKLERRTAKNDNLKLSIAINYGRCSNLVQACQSIAVDVQGKKQQACDIHEKMVEKALLMTRWMGEDTQNPDVIIRTSGDQRMGKFLLW
ncbi:hypothetical protein L7F22_066955 [Adiantum nelumboides]|nr:hypothetical protein [Adiantum nelumboides]